MKSDFRKKEFILLTVVPLKMISFTYYAVEFYIKTGMSTVKSMVWSKKCTSFLRSRFASTDPDCDAPSSVFLFFL